MTAPPHSELHLTVLKPSQISILLDRYGEKVSKSTLKSLSIDNAHKSERKTQIKTHSDADRWIRPFHHTPLLSHLFHPSLRPPFASHAPTPLSVHHITFTVLHTAFTIHDTATTIRNTDIIPCTTYTIPHPTPYRPRRAPYPLYTIPPPPPPAPPSPLPLRRDKASPFPRQHEQERY